MVDDIGIYGELKESQVIRKDIQKAAKGKGEGRGGGKDALECAGGGKDLEGGGMQKRGRAACFIRAATIGKGVSLLPLKARIQGLSLHRPPDLSAKKIHKKLCD